MQFCCTGSMLSLGDDYDTVSVTSSVLDDLPDSRPTTARHKVRNKSETPRGQVGTVCHPYIPTCLTLSENDNYRSTFDFLYRTLLNLGPCALHHKSDIYSITFLTRLLYFKGYNFSAYDKTTFAKNS